MATSYMESFHPKHIEENCDANVVFIHGLDGHHVNTWKNNPSDQSMWFDWLIDDFKNLGVWSVSYNSKSSRWFGNEPMPLNERAINISEWMNNNNIYDKPFILICHSLGGLIAKELLRMANDGRLSNPKIISSLKGIIFLATPHLGSGVADLVANYKILRSTNLTQQLQQDSALLTSLNEWFRVKIIKNEFSCLSFYETMKTKGVRLVVDRISSDLKIPDKPSIPVDEDHISICKPPNKTALVYQSCSNFIRNKLDINESKNKRNSNDIERYSKGMHINTKLYNQLENNGMPQFSKMIKFCSQIRDSNFATSFEEIAPKIINSEENLLIIVEGKSGTGKTALCHGLFYHLEEISKGSNFSIFYFNLSRFFQKCISPLASESNYSIDQFKDDFNSFIKSITNDDVFILDEIDDNTIYGPNDLEPYKKLIIDGFKAAACKTKIVSSQNIKKHNLAHEGPKIYLSTKSIANDDNLISEFLKEYVSFNYSNTKNYEILSKALKNFKFREVDFFTLSILEKSIDKIEDSIKTNELINESLEYLVLRKYGRDKDPIKIIQEASKSTFHHFYPNQLNSNNKIPEVPTVFKGNSLIEDYLIAHYVVSCILSFKVKQDIECFSVVHSDGVNRFIKELINVNKSTQEKTLNHLKQIYQNFQEVIKTEENNIEIYKTSIRGMTHACYLLGRFSDDSIRENAKEFLLIEKEYYQDSYKNGYLKNAIAPDDVGLLIRTIFISLAYLGDDTAANEYVERLLADQYEDDLNRGFHLEYYGDIDNHGSSIVNHKDNLCDCEKTFNHIAKKIKNHESRNSKTLIEIEVLTLLSLVQKRYVSKGITAYNDRTIELLDLISKKDVLLTSNRKLQAYCELIKECILDTNFSLCNYLSQLFELKKLDRAGWIRMGVNEKIDRVESVAEHTFSTFLITSLFLNENHDQSDEKFDRSKVINLLLHHDLAESIVGDIINKNEADLKSEENAIAKISLYGTFPGISNLSFFYDLWKEFEDKTSVEGKIAKDIDYIDSIYQLIDYKSRGFIKEKDFLDFKSNVAQKIETNTGKKMLEMVLNTFEQN
ncbi:HD domain-containing protein [Marinicella marina]|uniref:HD domain-containing protein n=1 Tax=Marinicella marina TaxID=2996016 RepID=UPI0024BD05BD|nr:HD domain-containing protein [Marinicella marina]MDJ1138811.1 HD domain-containing protein [Marinicella marina]